MQGKFILTSPTGQVSSHQGVYEFFINVRNEMFGGEERGKILRSLGIFLQKMRDDGKRGKQREYDGGGRDMAFSGFRLANN